MKKTMVIAALMMIVFAGLAQAATHTFQVYIGRGLGHGDSAPIPNYRVYVKVVELATFPSEVYFDIGLTNEDGVATGSYDVPFTPGMVHVTDSIGRWVGDSIYPHGYHFWAGTQIFHDPIFDPNNPTEGEGKSAQTTAAAWDNIKSIYR